MNTTMPYEKSPAVEESSGKSDSDVGTTQLLRDEEAEKSYG